MDVPANFQTVFEGVTFEAYEPTLTGINVVHLPENMTVKEANDVVVAIEHVTLDDETIWLLLPPGVGIQSVDMQTMIDYGWTRA